MGQIHITTMGYQDPVLHEGRVGVVLLRSLRTTSFILVLPEGEETMASCLAWLREDLWELVLSVLTLWLSHSINSLLCAGAVGSTKYSLNMAETDDGREGTQTRAEGMQGGLALLATIPPKSH